MPLEAQIKKEPHASMYSFALGSPQNIDSESCFSSRCKS